MLICVTNRQLCSGDFLQRVKQLAQAKPYALLLREKDLTAANYEQLAGEVKAVCDAYGVLLIAHQHLVVAEQLGLTHVQLPMSALRTYPNTAHNLHIGASVHSVAEAVEAQSLGAQYLLAGHIFATDCKLGALPRGLDFLQQVCRAVTVPVFAIGGLTAANGPAILATGAAGCCVMSQAMTCSYPEQLVRSFAFPGQG